MDFKEVTYENVEEKKSFHNKSFQNHFIYNIYIYIYIYIYLYNIYIYIFRYIFRYNNPYDQEGV